MSSGLDVSIAVTDSKQRCSIRMNNARHGVEINLPLLCVVRNVAELTFDAVGNEH